MIFATIRLPLPRDLAVGLQRIGFMDEDVALLAIVDERRRRRGVAGDDDSLVSRFEAKAEGIVHFSVVDSKSGDSNVCVSVNMAWHDLVRVDAISGAWCFLHAVQSVGDVDLPSLQDVLRHGSDAFRAVDLQRPLPPHDPGRQYQVRISGGM